MNKKIVYVIAYMLVNLLYLLITLAVYLAFRYLNLGFIEPGVWFMSLLFDILIFSKKCNKLEFMHKYEYELECIGLYLFYILSVCFIYSYGINILTIAISIVYAILFYALAPVWDFLGLL